MLNGEDMQGWNGNDYIKPLLIDKNQNSGLLERGWDNIQINEII